MKKRVAVIGAGWFGLHIAKYLKEQNFDTVVYDSNVNILSAASGKNQYRLHLGFHYPRNASTRSNNYRNYYKFLEIYSHLAEPIGNNYYCIVRDNSLLDFDTYKHIYDYEGINYKLSNTPTEYKLVNIEGSVSCEEMALNTTKTISYFKSIFKPSELKLGTAVTTLQNRDGKVEVNEEEFDYCINCSYNHFNPIKNLPVVYEACIVLIYRCNNPDLLNSAVTLMDGDFFSIYPIVDREQHYTLTHVKYTPMKVYLNAAECSNYLNLIAESDVQLQKEKIESDVLKYYPTFKEDFVYVDFFTSIKTKTASNSSNRDLHIDLDGNILNGFSGKILEIFELEKFVEKWLITA